MFSAPTALDYREQCFGGQAPSLTAARCWTWRERLLVLPSYFGTSVVKPTMWFNIWRGDDFRFTKMDCTRQIAAPHEASDWAIKHRHVIVNVTNFVLETHCHKKKFCIWFWQAKGVCFCSTLQCVSPKVCADNRSKNRCAFPIWAQVSSGQVSRLEIKVSCVTKHNIRIKTSISSKVLPFLLLLVWRDELLLETQQIDLFQLTNLSVKLWAFVFQSYLRVYARKRRCTLSSQEQTSPDGEKSASPESPCPFLQNRNAKNFEPSCTATPKSHKFSLTHRGDRETRKTSTHQNWEDRLCATCTVIGTWRQEAIHWW